MEEKDKFDLEMHSNANELSKPLDHANELEQKTQEQLGTANEE